MHPCKCTIEIKPACQVPEYEYWGIWEGKEVEGRLQGVPTLIMYAEPDFDHLVEFSYSNLFREYSHIYFASNWLEHYGYPTVKLALKTGAMVTLEITMEQLDKLPKKLRKKCHLMISIPAPFDWGKIKYTDTIRMDIAPFLTASFSAGTGFLSIPTDYENDILIHLAREHGQKREKKCLP